MKKSEFQFARKADKNLIAITEEKPLFMSLSFNAYETHKLRISKAKKSLKILDLPQSISLILDPKDNFPPRDAQNSSFSSNESEEYKNLIGLEKRQAMQHKLVSSNKQLEQEIINYKEELQDLIIPISDIAYDIVDQKFDKFPLLELRKSLLNIQLAIAEFSRFIVSSQIFEWFIISVIIVNVMLLLLESPDYPSTESSRFLDKSFIYIYTIECILKIFANGLVFNKQAYFKDWWNLIDFTIVVTSWVDISGGSSPNLKPLRTLRILRPLRGVSSIEGVRVLILSLFMSLKPLTNALIVLFIVISIFAIIGLQLWTGILRNRCLDLETGIIGNVCGYKSCRKGEFCVYTIENPFNGTLSFDNFFYSWLNVFQVITLEGWSNMMTLTEENFSEFSLLYFIPLILFGNMLILNLTVAVLTSTFTEALHEIMNKKNVALTVEQIIRMKQKYTIRKTIVPYDILFDNQQENLNESLQIHQKIEDIDELFDINNIKTNKLTIENYSSNNLNINNQHQSFAPTLVWRGSNKYIQEIQKSLQYARVFSIRANNKRFDKLYINDKFPVCSSNSNDIIEFKLIKAERIPGLFYQDDLELAAEREASGLVFEKYCEFTKWELFKVLYKKVGKKNSFFLLSFSVKSFVQQQKYADCGEWSGEDVCAASCERHQQEKQTQNFLKFRKIPKFHYYFSYLQKLCFLIVASKFFNIAMSGLVILNIVALASDHYGISADGSKALLLINSVCTLVFILEFNMKLIGYGVQTFIKDLMNTLDFIVIVLSLLDFYFSQSTGFNAFRALRILRLFRVIKVFRIFRYLNSIIQLIMLISNSISKFMYLFLLLMLLQVIFTLLGMEIYGKQFDFPEGLPRANFDSFHWAFMTMFQVLTNENWDEVLRYCMRSSAGHWSAVFLVIWIILGNFILLNLFLGILLGAFELDTNQEHIDQDTFKSKMVIYGNLMHKKTKEIKLKEKYKEKFGDIENDDDDEYSLNQINTFTLRETISEDYQTLSKTSYGIFSLSNPLREFFLKIVLNSKFEIFITILTILNMITLIWETYIISKPDDKRSALASKILDVLFTSSFFLEFLIKSIALGFWLGPGTYLKDNWNKLDLVILVLSLIDISVASVEISIVKLLRSLRILRPLKLIRYNTSMKIVLKALINSILSSFNVIAVISIIWVIFAILGVSLFNGKLYYCSNQEIKNMSDCYKSGFNWVNNVYNYDNIFEALLTLFIISTQETWPDRMYNIVDAYAVENAPIKNYNPGAAYFIVFYVFIGDFFLINLFTIVVYTKFTQAKLEESSMTSVLLNRKQLDWIEVQKMVLKSKPALIHCSSSDNSFKSKVHKLVSSTFFKIFMLVIILINTVQMAMTYEGSSKTYALALNIVNDICTYVFIIEALLKIIALGAKGYFQSHWNKFDFFVVLCSITFIITRQYLNQNLQILKLGPQLFRVLRVLRISRIVKLFDSLKYLQDLMNVILFSMPSALNVLCLILIFFMMYSILGVYLFWEVTGTYLNSDWNFSNFHKAMLILWRISTGEDYPYIMKDCIEYYDNKMVALFFTSFIAVTTFILMEFFVSVIIQNYKEFMENPTSAVHIFSTFVKKFKSIWIKYSRKYQGIKIEYSSLLCILKELGSDICVNENLDVKQLKKLVYIMRLYVDPQGYIYYHDLLYASMRRRYSKSIKGKSEKFVERILDRQEALIFKNLKKLRVEMRSKQKETPDYHDNNHGNLLMSLYYTKIFFGAWKKLFQRRKFKHSKRSQMVVTSIDNYSIN